MLLMAFIALNARSQNYSNLELVENKGQWPSQVKFKAVTTTGAFFLQPDGYTMLLHNRQDLQELSERQHGHSHTAQDSNISARPASAKGDKLVLRSHAYEMKFLYASATTEVVPDKPLNTYNNYFIGNDPSKWASNCRIFQGVTYKNLYPGVDVRYYTDEGRLKYDLVVNPGASVDKIAMHFNGVDGLEVRDEKLVIKTSVDDVQELKPYTYQPLSTGKREISNKYEVEGNIVRFKLGTYDKTKVLVIDPTLVFATFSGSTADNWGYTATYDDNGNFYGGGIVFGSGFPTSSGAFQTTYSGGVNEGSSGPYDIGIIKLDPTGSSRIYATYIGGSDGNEQPHSLVADAQGNLVIAGRTSSTNYPGTIYGPGGGGWDIVLTKLNAAGTALIGSRKIGGGGWDGVNIRPKSTFGAISINRNYGDDARSEVILDGTGNVYLASCTQSADFPVTAGAFQPVKGAAQDGVVIKLTPDLGTVLFSSFLGGNGDDAAFVLTLASNGNIIVAGSTASTSFPGTLNGPVISSTFNGITDGYVSIISNTGALLLKSTYLGTNAIDMVYGVQVDKTDNIYVMGTTEGAWPTTSNVVFRIPNGKQFISKLQPDLSAFVYSTTFGKTGGFTPQQIPDISPVALLVDRCENVYVSGWGGQINNIEQWYSNQSTNGLPVAGLPPGSTKLRANTDGSDFYYFVLERNARSQLFGAFFGAFQGELGDHVDGGTSRFDKNGVIYQAQCGFCGGGPNPFPTTAGSWSPNSGNVPRCNLAMVKIAMELSGVAASVKSFVNGTPRKTGCIPLTVDFKDTLAMGTRYIWNFGDGSPDETTTAAQNSHTYNNIGTYTIRLVSIDSSTCNITDTSYTTINVRQDIAKLDFRSTKLPPCDNLTYRFDNLSVPPAAPGKPFTNQTFRWNFGDGVTQVAGTNAVTHTYASRGTYNVTLSLIDTNYCNYPDSITKQVRIAENVKAEFTTPPFGCAPYDAVFNNISAGGQVFQWDFGDGATSTQTNPTHHYPDPGTYTIRLIAIDSATCNFIDSTKFTITVSGSPTALFSYTPNPPQVNTAVTFTNQSIGGTSYLWNFGDGDTLFTILRDTTVKHFYNATGKFNTCLVVYNQYGCTDTLCTPIVATVIPALDVPNAFTPNGDGVNDEVHVKGFAIGKMNWRIYNRWGQLVFTTTNRNQGWDGRYKGILQPQEVYTYTLEIEFTDGTRATKTGDITLLR
jgi:gliding motility-associated-like protein